MRADPAKQAITLGAYRLRAELWCLHAGNYSPRLSTQFIRDTVASGVDADAKLGDAGGAAVPSRATTILKAGQAAPLFSLPDPDMRRVDLARYRGRKNVVLYFYPRDGTPACTLQATDFSDHEDDFARLDCVVIGVSPDDYLCHAEFRDANGVSIVLLADTECEVCEKYGVLQGDAGRDGAPGNAAAPAGSRPSAQPADAFAHVSAGRHVTRATFVIDKRGVVRHAMYHVNQRGHALQVLNLVKGLRS